MQAGAEYEEGTSTEDAARPARPRGWFGWLVYIMGAAGTACIAAIMVLMNTDIIAKGAFDRPLAGVPEMVTASLAVIVFLQLPSALRSGRMVKTDGVMPWLISRVPRFAAVLEAIYHLLGAGMFGVLTYATWRLFLSAWTTDDQFGVPGEFSFAKWPIQATVCFGCGVMMVQYLLVAVQHLRRGPAAADLATPGAGER